MYTLFMKNTFNFNLALYRKRAGMSQRELSRAVDVTHRTVAYYESETNSIPLDKLEKIAVVLNVKPGDLVNPIDGEDKELYDTDIRLLKKLHEIKNLPDRDQRAISNHINALIEKNKNKQATK